MRNIHFFGFLILGIFFLNSCVSPKKVVYINDMQPQYDYAATAAPEIKVQKFDRLQITVSSRTPELTVPFNSGVDGYIVSESGQVTGTNTNINKGFLVTEDGNITYPILGTLMVEGKTIKQIQEMIQDLLVKGKYINDPTVNIDLINLKINVIGEVNAVGIQSVPDSRITILDAISKAGGLTRNAASDRIIVIREENGVRRQYINNIEGKEIFDSPVFYLKQNDIVYVEPIAAVSTPREDRNWRYLTTVLGSVTLILTIFNAVK